MMPPLMVLAAGYGTRLRPLTDELPKPLVPLGDRSVLAHVAERLRATGFERMVLNAHHLADAVEAHAATLPLAATVVREAEILGTAGGVRNAAALLGGGEVLVHNGDTLVDLDVAALSAAHAARAPLATLACTKRPPGEGTLGIGDGDRVVRLRGERFGEELCGADFVGVQIVSAALRARLPDRGCLVGDAYLPALRAGEAIVAAPVARSFEDIGSPEAYLAANLRWLGGPASFIAEDARVDKGVALMGCIIGAGARIDGSGALERVVVWPGAHARAPLRDAVVTTRGRVVQLSRR